MEIEEPLQMQTDRGRPMIFRWRGQFYDVRQTIDSWVEHSFTPQEKREYFKVYTNGGTMELYASTRRGWVLAKVYSE